MRTLKVRLNPIPFDYPEDLERIIKVCADNDYAITTEQAQLAWREYSESMCAGWMMLPKGDLDLLNTVLMFCEVENDHQIVS